MAARGLSKVGAYVRQAAKSSLKYGNGSAEPGRPPKVHRAGSFTRATKAKGQVVRRPVSPLKELIFFALTSDKMSVVIGPAEFRNSSLRSRVPTSWTAPRLLEQGGTIATRLRSGRSRVSRYRGNPFMRPAMDRELPKFAVAFAGTFKK